MPRVPLGPPIPRSDADLDRLSEITQDDILEAALWFRAVMPAKWKTLLDAPLREDATRPDQDQPANA